MSVYKDKPSCCGCYACAQKCPQQCITMTPDHEGFAYPVVDKSRCTACGMCEKICPALNLYPPTHPMEVLAAAHKDDRIREASSSGGVFTLLATRVIQSGGVVFGARFDEQWLVVMDYTEQEEGLEAFRGSKYVQCNTGDTFKQAETFLKQGRQVLYTGTPCQIAGLKRYLRKEYENLLAVDFVCHGTPSP